MAAKSKTRPAKAGSPPLKTLAQENAGALHPDDSVQTAGTRMREHDTSKWPVARDRKLVGMIDQKDPDWKLGGRGHDPKTGKVGQIMSKDVIFCYEDEDCASAQRVMDERGLSYLPVVDREMHVVGIFSREEIQAKTQAPVENSAAPTAS
ncbi:CBS domain-containing protein [Prosthecobacter sp.]|uniref:CBS domain-containing protein n=1 Tax=Prosthecobacter sp. TaxID=1965333 RepID=UPI0037838003